MNKLNFSLVVVLLLTFSLLIPSSYAQQEEDFVFKGEVVLGKIEKTEVSEKSVAIKSRTGEIVSLIVSDEETIIWIDDEEKEIEDIKKGSEVEAKYRINEKNQKIASWIDIITEEDILAAEEKIKKEEKEEIPPEKTAPEKEAAPEEIKEAEEKEDIPAKETLKEEESAENTQDIKTEETSKK
jgi:hypothetical protein